MRSKNLVGRYIEFASHSFLILSLLLSSCSSKLINHKFQAYCPGGESNPSSPTVDKFEISYEDINSVRIDPVGSTEMPVRIFDGNVIELSIYPESIRETQVYGNTHITTPPETIDPRVLVTLEHPDTCTFILSNECGDLYDDFNTQAEP